MLDNKGEFADRRVVIVDDNRNFRELLRAMLRNFGVRRTDSFDDAEGVLPFLRQNRVDLMMIDLVMPDTACFDLVRALRRDATVLNRAMPVVLFTAHASRTAVLSAVTAGMDDVIVKPASPRTVFEHAHRLLARPPRYISGLDGYVGPDVAARLRGTVKRPEQERARAGRLAPIGSPRRHRSVTERVPAPPTPVPAVVGQITPVPGLGGARQDSDPAFMLV
jgi:DNA-binding response OmpR family regulator